MEDPVRKVGGGGTAGGDRWEGEDEDEDVKVGSGWDARQRERGLALLRVELPPAGGRVGRLSAQGRRPGLRAVCPGASVGLAVFSSPSHAGHVGWRRQPVFPDSLVEGGGGLRASLSLGVRAPA